MKTLLFLIFSFHLSAIPIKVPTELYAKWENTRNDPGMDPFIGHLSFRNICDHIIDQNTEWFDPALVKQGDLIYLNIWYLHWFVEQVHDQIPHPYILVSGDVGAWFPMRETKKVLYDPKLAAWFCRNMVFSYHPKLFQLPMGQDLNLFFSAAHQKDELTPARNELAAAHEEKSQIAKEHLLSMNFYPREHGDRDMIAQFFRSRPYCFRDPNLYLPPNVYYRHLASTKFTLSPLGFETDCVRTWEAISLDCIPVVEHTFNDPIYEGMPILIVDDWTKIDEQLLETKYEELKNLSREKAYFQYWQELIKNTQKKVQNNDLAFTQLKATLFSQDEIETIHSIMEGRDPSIYYKGFLSTLRPLQLSNQSGFNIALYDPWLDQDALDELCEKTNLSDTIFLLSSEKEFKEAVASDQFITVFIDFTYYRTSLILNFDKSVCSKGNFRHSLKSDFDLLIDNLPVESLVFGNRADDPYVKKVLDALSKERGIKMARHGSFWSLTKEQSRGPLLDTFLSFNYPQNQKIELPFQISKWVSHASKISRLIQDYSTKNILLVGKTVSSLAIFLGELIPSDGKIFVIDNWQEELRYQQFLSNVVYAGLTERIIPVRMAPPDAMDLFRHQDLDVDLIYIDSSPTYSQLLELLKKCMVFDRALISGEGWTYPSFQIALNQFATNRNQIPYFDGDFWMFKY